MEDFDSLLQKHDVVALRRIPFKSVSTALAHLQSIEKQWDLMSNPRIPQDGPDRGSGLYCRFQFVNRLLKKDGFVNIRQLYHDCLQYFGPILEPSDFLNICREEIVYLQSLGGVIEILE